jgi:hypothetical protein
MRPPWEAVDCLQCHVPSAMSQHHTARVKSVSESTGACMRPHATGDRKRESSPRAAPQLAKMQPQEGSRRQVAEADDHA